MCPFVSADVRGGGRLRDEPKECLRRRLEGGKRPKRDRENDCRLFIQRIRSKEGLYNVTEVTEIA